MTMESKLSYLVCGVQRSGSGWLCEGLRSTGVAGVPSEYYMPAFSGSDALDLGIAGFEDSAWARERGVTTWPDFLAATLQEGRTANGVFASKLQWNGFEPLLEKLRTYTPYGGTATIRQLLGRAFGKPRYLYLTRRDRVRQAVSWALAGQTGHAASTQAAQHAPLAEPSFDPELLDDLLRLIRKEEAGWASLFDVLGVEPLRLVYEDWSEDLPGTVDAIFRWLEVPASRNAFDPSQMTLERQATALNEEWATRYRALRSKDPLLDSEL